MLDTFPLPKLKELLEKSKAADSECKRFGAKSHHYEWNPPVSVDAVEQFEQKIGVTLPDDYRTFLLEAGNGGAGPFYGLFSLKDVERWLTWDVEPEKIPLLSPETDEEQFDDEDENWRCGCIPIGSQGDTYFTYLLVTGPNRGRVVYIEYDGGWVFFPREQSFISWYERWLREVSSGYNIFWFATYLDGDEQELREYYEQAQTEEEKLLAIHSMDKFPSFSQGTVEFLKRVIRERINEPSVKGFLELLLRADPKLFYQYLQDRWDAGYYDGVVEEINYSVLHFENEKQHLIEVWRSRILERLPQLSCAAQRCAVHILQLSGAVSLGQVRWMIDGKDPEDVKYLLGIFSKFPDVAQHLNLWIGLLQERENLELLEETVLTTPTISDPILKNELTRIRDEFSTAEKRLYEEKDIKQYHSLRLMYNIHKNVCWTLNAIFYEEINPTVPGVPRPYRLELDFRDVANYHINAPAPENGIPIHPMIALAVLHQFHHLPSNRSKWESTLQKIKHLTLEANQKTVDYKYEHTRSAYLAPAGEYPLPKPYYYKMKDWSAIALMENLQKLTMSHICVEDFSFLPKCSALEHLSLFNTNFSDCRLLLEIPNLKSVDLRLCRLEHKEVLQSASFEYTL